MEILFSVETLIEQTLTEPDEWRTIDESTAHDFYRALMFLANEGLSADQVQWLLRQPFSKFGEHEFDAVMILAAALDRNTVSVAQLHEALQGQELWARMHHQTTLFRTEFLPSMEQIAEDLGLCHSSGEASLPVAEAPRWAH